MGSERIDEQLLTNYLMGKLTEDEQSQVEDRVFSDSDSLAALEDAEADLIDAYVRGSLPEAERRVFELRFLTSPSRRTKVEFAKALAKVTAQSTVARQAPGVWQRMLRFLQGGTQGLQFAVACSALVLIGGSAWLALQNAAMRSRLAGAQGRRMELEARNQQLSRQLQDTRGVASGQLGQIPALLLLPGISRSSARVVQLTLPASAQIMHIDIQVEARDDYPQFRAELRTGGQEVLTRANLRPGHKGESRVVSFDLPASALTSGQYELALKGVGAGGSETDVGYYYFVVNKP